MSSILHPIHSARQKCRPKHQVLVLKCYPKYQKTVQEVKPNSSELSYLCYYASTRPTKLQKVGAFLEKKTAADVWRSKMGNVQVTLQVLTAIIEKTPRELTLYSRSVLTILDTILRSKDITMVEESVHTFEVLCKHMDAVSITGDQQRAQQLLQVIQLYSSFATQGESAPAKLGDSLPLSLRWRTVGLRAIRAVAASDVFANDFTQQINVIMPVILENLELERSNILQSLQHKVQTSERIDQEVARRRRMSAATVTTVDTIEGNPVLATETTADADRAAEDEVRVLAVRCLKQIFALGIGTTRGLTRMATAQTLKYIAIKNPPLTAGGKLEEGSWATSLIDAIARWTPVQDRFIIVLTAVETLVRAPIHETLLEKQLVLATLIDWILSSSINLIGLSVMDILLGFVRHILLLLQLGGKDMKLAPTQRGNDMLGLLSDMNETFGTSNLLVDSGKDPQRANKETSPSPLRQELLSRLQSCIASLSNHIYYTDQITDMLTAILARLKPTAATEITAAVNDPAATTKAIAESAGFVDDPNVDGFFSFVNARIIALKVIKRILIRANHKRGIAGATIEARARVGIQVWQGTQWLLKDEDPTVRIAYVDALLTWLKLETNSSDLLVPKSGPRKTKPSKLGNKTEAEVARTKRNASNASKRETRQIRSTFGQLIHLAIYDSILDRPTDQMNLLMLYLLLTHLVDRLGVNAVRSGLPMMMRLQQVTLSEAELSPLSKMYISSIVHGYLWTIAEKFDFEATKIGYEINGEISRRKKYGLWLDPVKFPSLSIDHITRLRENEKQPVANEEAVGTIRPFLNMPELVREVSNAYDTSLLAPVVSTPSSPGRVFSVPTLGFGYGYGSATGPKPSPEDQLPQKVKDEMSAAWTRESCIASVEKESSGSVAGSRTGRSSGPKHLQANGTARAGSVSGRETPAMSPTGEEPPAVTNLTGLAALLQRRESGQNTPVGANGTSSRESIVRVLDLKRALSGYNPEVRHASPLRKRIASSKHSVHTTDSDSMMSWNEIDEKDLSTAQLAESDTVADIKPENETKASPDQQAGPTATDQSTTTAYHQVTTSQPTAESAGVIGVDIGSQQNSGVLSLPGAFPRETSPVRPATSHGGEGYFRAVEPILPRPASSKAPQNTNSTNFGSVRGKTRPSSRHGGASGQHRPASEKFDLQELLAAIPPNTVSHDSANPKNRLHLGDRGRETFLTTSSAISRPPY